jgi:hypothetical protein
VERLLCWQAQSELGSGTRFEIYFPAISVLLAAPLTSDKLSADSSPEGRTVLLVEDESVLVHAIGEFLRDSGYIVLDAFSSQDPLALAKEHRDESIS